MNCPQAEYLVRKKLRYVSWAGPAHNGFALISANNLSFWCGARVQTIMMEFSQRFYHQCINDKFIIQVDYSSSTMYL
jgi:hypothetical protein